MDWWKSNVAKSFRAGHGQTSKNVSLLHQRTHYGIKSREMERKSLIKIFSILNKYSCPANLWYEEGGGGPLHPLPPNPDARLLPMRGQEGVWEIKIKIM